MDPACHPYTLSFNFIIFYTCCLKPANIINYEGRVGRFDHCPPIEVPLCSAGDCDVGFRIEA